MLKYLLLGLFSLNAYAKIQVAITVDDLPSHSGAPAGTDRVELARRMVAVLKAHNVPEVYGFLNAGRSPDDLKLMEVARVWIAGGYPLGNHTYSHKSLNEISVDEFKSEIEKNEPILRSLSGERDWKYFRYPYLREGDSLEKRNAIRDFLKTKGYKIAQVTIDWEDWSWNEPFARCTDKKDEKKIDWLRKTYIDNAVAKLHEADYLAKKLFKRTVAQIVLLHIGAFDTEMLDRLLARYEKEGVEFIPLSKAVKDAIYEFDPKVVGPWGSEFTYQVMKSRGIKRADLGLKPYEGYPEKELEKACL
jgi:peptidoglycan/xylan/chitin deacetylase (PgdA/CDA1 family)